MARQSLYGAARFGDIVVNKYLRPTASGWAVVLLTMAALSLAGCGRKGALDLPPTANAQAAAPTDTETEAASKGSLFNPNYGTDAPPAAAKGSKKPFILDPLLDEK
jgi:predicted small lipoprotein YifL